MNSRLIQMAASNSTQECSQTQLQSLDSPQQIQISLMASERRQQMEHEFNSLHMCMKISSSCEMFIANLRSKFESECNTLEQQILSELSAASRRAQHDHDAFCNELVKTFEMRINLICQNYKRYIEVKKIILIFFLKRLLKN